MDYPDKLDQHEQAQREYGSSLDMTSRKERHRRRTALEIKRKFICKYKGCSKSYGSEGSRSKHNKFYQQIVDKMILTRKLGDHSNYSDCSEIGDKMSKSKINSAKIKSASGRSSQKAIQKKTK